MKRKTLIVAFLLALFNQGTVYSQEKATSPLIPPLPKIERKKTMVTLKTTQGAIKIELFGDQAPKTVKNFIDYAKDKYYEGTIFHRVIENFMIQGGGFTQEMEQKTTKSAVQNEADNGLKNDRGTVAMARTSDPHSATSQFFINTVDNDNLNYKSSTPSGWGYCVFGKVVEGMDVVDAIRAVETGRHGPYGDVPTETIVIQEVTLGEVEAIAD